MGVMISMLRGVNLGPHNRMKMEELRAVYESLKLQDPRTYVQSGNVLFKTKERDEAKLSSRIQDGIEKKFGFRPDVILRTTEELRTAVGEESICSAEEYRSEQIAGDVSGSASCCGRVREAAGN